MSKRVVWVSLRRLKVHEFQSTLRYIKLAGLSWREVFLKLGELYNASLRRFTKQNLAILAIYLATNSLSDGSLVQLSFGDVTASVAIEYVAFLASLYIYYSVLQLQTSLALLQLKVIEGNKLRIRGFSADHFAFFHEQDHFSLSTPVLLNAFFDDRFGFSRALLIISILVLLFSALPIFFVLSFFFKIQLEIIRIADILDLRFAISAIGLLILTLSLLFFAIFNVPIPMYRKNSSIRWGFLYPIRTTQEHPQAQKWVDAEINR